MENLPIDSWIPKIQGGNTSSIMSVVYKKSRQVATFEMGLGSSCLEKVVIPYTKFPFDES